MREALSIVSQICLSFIATIKYLEFKKVLDEEFKEGTYQKNTKPAETLVYCMFDSTKITVLTARI